METEGLMNNNIVTNKILFMLLGFKSVVIIEEMYLKVNIQIYSTVMNKIVP